MATKTAYFKGIQTWQQMCFLFALLTLALGALAPDFFIEWTGDFRMLAGTCAIAVILLSIADVGLEKVLRVEGMLEAKLTIALVSAPPQTQPITDATGTRIGTEDLYRLELSNPGLERVDGARIQVMGITQSETAQLHNYFLVPTNMPKSTTLSNVVHGQPGAFDFIRNNRLESGDSITFLLNDRGAVVELQPDLSQVITLHYSADGMAVRRARFMVRREGQSGIAITGPVGEVEPVILNSGASNG